VIVQFFKGRSQGVKEELGRASPGTKAVRREAVCNHKRDGDGCKGERVEIVCRGKKNERFINANDDDNDEARS